MLNVGKIEKVFARVWCVRVCVCVSRVFTLCFHLLGDKCRNQNIQLRIIVFRLYGVVYINNNFLS